MATAVTSTAGRKALAKKGQTAYGTSYPVPNVAYLKKALQAVGRVAPGKRAQLGAFLRKRARQLGAMNVIKGSWADNSKGKKQMCNAMRVALLEFGMDPKQVKLEVIEFAASLPDSVLEFATYTNANSGDGQRTTKNSGSGTMTKSKYENDPLYKKTYAAMMKRPGMTADKACKMADAACRLRDRRSGKA